MNTRTLLFRRLMDQAGGEEQTGGGGGEVSTPSFLDTFEPEVRTSLEKAGISDAAGLAKQWADAQSYIGSSIRVPSQEAGEEDRKAFYEKIQKHAPDLIPRPDADDQAAMDALWSQLGRPADAAEYQLPEGLNAEQVGDLTKYAHEAGLTNTQFKSLVSKMAEQETVAQEQAKQAHEQSIAALRQEWGQAFEQNIQTVARLAEQTGAPEAIVAAAKEGALDADVAKWMHSMVQRLGNEGNEMVASQGDSRAMTPDEARQMVDEIYANREHPFFNPSHPSHEAAKKKVVQLMAYSNGRKPPQ